MNAKALKSVMVLNGDNTVSLANYLGISEQSFRNKMRENGTSFKQGEIAMIVLTLFLLRRTKRQHLLWPAGGHSKQ